MEMSYNDILRSDLASFIQRCFYTVDPGVEFIDNWHIDLIADRLEKATNSKIRRLIINVPPRSLKSICVSVAWPAWILGDNPSAKIIVASYSQILSLKHSLDCKLVMNSDWYKAAYPDIKIAEGQNEKFKFVTTKRGFRFATSVGGTATGEGGDYLIVDDPHNPIQAASDVQRQASIDWFDQTFMSRLNNKKKGVVVVVMQRLHNSDLTGHLVSKSGVKWSILSLPAISDKNLLYYYKGRRKVYRKGELLNSSREGARELESIKQDLGSYAYSPQYLQQPITLKGGMVDINWFRRYDNMPETGNLFQSWDTAIKTGAQNDVSVCTIWSEFNNCYYLLDMIAKKMEYPFLKMSTISLAEKWRPQAVLIEDKASGQSLLQDLKREANLPVISISPKGDKVSRFAAITALIEAGRVFLPKSADWLVDYETQIMAFPNVQHDDMVDSTSQFLNWIRNKSTSKPTIRVL